MAVNDYDPVVAPLTLAASCLSAFSTLCVLVCFLVLRSRHRTFRHALVLNLTLSDFVNSLNNSVSGSIYVHMRRPLTPSPACTLNGWVAQLSVQATDFSILAISLSTLFVVKRRASMTGGTGAKWAICLGTWVVPLITSTIVASMQELKPVSGNWCWIAADRVDLRYGMTHAWRIAIILVTIGIYSYLLWHVTRGFREMKQFMAWGTTGGETGSTEQTKRGSGGLDAVLGYKFGGEEEGAGSYQLQPIARVVTAGTPSVRIDTTVDVRVHNGPVLNTDLISPTSLVGGMSPTVSLQSPISPLSGGPGRGFDIDSDEEMLFPPRPPRRSLSERLERQRTLELERQRSRSRERSPSPFPRFLTNNLSNIDENDSTSNNNNNNTTTTTNDNNDTADTSSTDKKQDRKGSLASLAAAWSAAFSRTGLSSSSTSHHHNPNGNASTTSTTITSNSYLSHPPTKRKVEREIKRMLLLNGFPILYVLLWIPGLLNRILEAAGYFHMADAERSRLGAILQTPTQLIGFANAVTYAVVLLVRDRRERPGSARLRAVPEGVA